VGLYTSPHLVSMSERITVDGEPISEAALADWTERLQGDIERLDASFFEATTAIAFADLAARGVDIAVIEVGLGGRLDATNVITPLASVVTKIALEHTDYLGPTLGGIAREKAGIAKRDVPFVTGEPDTVNSAGNDRPTEVTVPELDAKAANVKAVVPRMGRVVFVQRQKVPALTVPSRTSITAPSTSDPGTEVVASWSMSNARVGVTPTT